MSDSKPTAAAAAASASEPEDPNASELDTDDEDVFQTKLKETKGWITSWRSVTGVDLLDRPLRRLVLAEINKLSEEQAEDYVSRFCGGPNWGELNVLSARLGVDEALLSEAKARYPDRVDTIRARLESLAQLRKEIKENEVTKPPEGEDTRSTYQLRCAGCALSTFDSAEAVECTEDVYSALGDKGYSHRAHPCTCKDGDEDSAPITPRRHKCTCADHPEDRRHESEIAAPGNCRYGCANPRYIRLPFEADKDECGVRYCSVDCRDRHRPIHAPYCKAAVRFDSLVAEREKNTKEAERRAEELREKKRVTNRAERLARAQQKIDEEAICARADARRIEAQKQSMRNARSAAAAAAAAAVAAATTEATQTVGAKRKPTDTAGAAKEEEEGSPAAKKLRSEGIADAVPAAAAAAVSSSTPLRKGEWHPTALAMYKPLQDIGALCYGYVHSKPPAFWSAVPACKDKTHVLVTTRSMYGIDGIRYQLDPPVSVKLADPFTLDPQYGDEHVRIPLSWSSVCAVNNIHERGVMNHQTNSRRHAAWDKLFHDDGPNPGPYARRIPGSEKAKDPKSTDLRIVMLV